MLSIGKLGHGQESYYLETVASGAEDYYIGRGEAPGRWLGTMTAELGLDGRVSADDLRQVLAGVDPISGDRFARGGERRVPGFDLTFCAPKSVSVLWGLGDREVSAVVRAAHDTSVDAALRYLEEQACWSRRGTNGFVQLRGDGFVAAAFRHRTSRAGDPHLHSHVVVANATRSDDGRWGALDARHLYLHAKTAGYLYEAHLRAELTVRLGVEWTPVVNGIADIVGIPATVLDRFSTRRHEIEAELAERGESSARAAQYAVLETRQAKDYDVDPLLLHGLWTEQVAETRLGPRPTRNRARQDVCRADRRACPDDWRPAPRTRRAHQTGQHVRSPRGHTRLVRRTHRRRRHQRHRTARRRDPRRSACRAAPALDSTVRSGRCADARTDGRSTHRRPDRATRPKTSSTSKAASWTAPSPTPTSRSASPTKTPSSRP